MATLQLWLSIVASIVGIIATLWPILTRRTLSELLGSTPANGVQPPVRHPWSASRIRTIIGLLILALGVIGISVSIFAAIGHQRAIDKANAVATATYAAKKALMDSNPLPYPPYVGSLALIDPLGDNTKGQGWEERPDSSIYGSCRFSGEAYHVSATSTHYRTDCYARLPSYTNFAFEVYMRILTKGDCGGLLFRADSDNNKYDFAVCQDGTYNLSIYPGISGKYLVRPEYSSAIKTSPDQVNVIAVVANGDTIQLYVNGTFLGEASDTTSSQGKIAFIAEGKYSPTEVEYIQTRVWTLSNASLALDDPLRDNTKGYTWDETVPSSTSCKFMGGAYHASDSLPNNFVTCSAAPSFRNFSYEVAMTILKGDCGGLTFRNNKTDQYVFDVCGNGTYDLTLYSDKPPQSLMKEPLQNPAIKTGPNQTNVIAVVANGNTIQLYVNGTFLRRLNDSFSSVGKIGVIAEDTADPTEVEFTNVKVWTF